MTVRHTEDGIGWDGLVPSKEERMADKLRKKAGEKYTVSLTQEEWESLRTGGFVERTLRSRHQDILIVIQREE